MACKNGYVTVHDKNQDMHDDVHTIQTNWLRYAYVVYDTHNSNAYGATACCRDLLGPRNQQVRQTTQLLGMPIQR